MTITDPDRTCSSFEAEVRRRLDDEQAVLAQARREDDDLQEVISAGVIHDLTTLAEHNDVHLDAANEG